MKDRVGLSQLSLKVSFAHDQERDEVEFVSGLCCLDIGPKMSAEDAPIRVQDHGRSRTILAIRTASEARSSAAIGTDRQICVPPQLFLDRFSR